MKLGRTFEKFLGTKDYDDKLLLPFEGFLHASFCKYSKWNGHDRDLLVSYLAAEDRAARSLSVKPEQVEGEIGDGEVETTEESENQDEVAKEKISDSHDDVHTCTDREKGEKAELSGGKSQYEKSKEKNFKISSQT